MCLQSLFLLMLLFLAGTAHAQEGAPTAEAGAEVRRIEVGAAATEPATVFIQPGLSTTLLFSLPLARNQVALERRESFRWVEIGEHSLSLVPLTNLPHGTRLRLEVRFAEGSEFARAVFQLEVSSARVDRQVEVGLLLGSCESCEKQLREAWDDVAQCREALKENRAAPCEGEVLTGLLTSGMMDGKGIRARRVKPKMEEHAPGKVNWAISFRSAGRIAVWLEVQFPEAEVPWRMKSAAVFPRKEEGSRVPGTWRQTPPVQGRSTLIIEATAGRGDLRQDCVLELREAGGSRILRVGNVRFP